MSIEYRVRYSHLDYHPRHRSKLIYQSLPGKRIDSSTLKGHYKTKSNKSKEQLLLLFVHTTSLSIRPFLSLNFVNLFACSEEIL